MDLLATTIRGHIPDPSGVFHALSPSLIGLQKGDIASVSSARQTGFGRGFRSRLLSNTFMPPIRHSAWAFGRSAVLTTAPFLPDQSEGGGGGAS
ncbi:unnamed protein product [Protopolystoma xenopodis]|uniref:Uncharacterized protein n=1 Tax=Protopolystoma xenopodis TaxID=117903 RepID=A0A448XD02_9PLAT|nr:unnamed protein product [Protopolystoma xenopodis]